MKPAVKAQSRVQQIIAELSVARDGSSIRDVRLGDAARRASASAHSEILGNQRAAGKLIEHIATEAGIETDKFDPILARNRIALQRVADERKAAAITNSTSVLKTFIDAIDGRRRAFEHLTPAAAPPTFIALDSPFLILPTTGNKLLDSSIAPFRSFAKVTIASQLDDKEVGFYFLWENPSDRYAVINVDGYLVFNGLIGATESGGFLPGNRFATMNVSGVLRTFEWWNQPPTEPLAQADQSQLVRSITADMGGGFGDVGDIESAHVFRGVDLSHTLFLVPPYGVTVIEVAAVLWSTTGTDGGDVSADFSSGDLQIMCPFVQIAVLT